MSWLQTYGFWVICLFPTPLSAKFLLFQCVNLQNFGLSENLLLSNHQKQQSNRNDKQNQKSPAG